MEDVLEFGRGCQDLAIILMGVWGGGRQKWNAGRLPCYRIYRGGVRGGRGVRRGEGEQICPCTKCSHVHVASTLSLFLISPFCCCSLSRYKKVPQERNSFYFCSTERNSELFSLPRKGLERNSEVFCSAEQPEFRLK